MSRTEQAPPERPKNAPTGPQHGPMAQRVNERAINFGPPSLKRWYAGCARRRRC